MDNSRANYFVSHLARKGVTLPCPRCGHPHFSVVGETTVQLAGSQGLLGLGTTPIPAAVVGCNNCGFLSLHAVSALEWTPPGIVAGARNG